MIEANFQNESKRPISKIFRCLLPLLFVLNSSICQNAEWLAKPQLQHLFEARTNGYHTYRIPGILFTKKGSLLVWGEARKQIGDWSEIAIVMKRSEDLGKTWSDVISIVQPPKGSIEGDEMKAKAKNKYTLGNSVMIADQNGWIHLLYCVNYREVYHAVSSDDGRSFSNHRRITPVFEKFKEEYPWKVIATGPGHSIQLENGRLIVPIWMSTGELPGGHRPSESSVVYSDDHGNSWKRGEIAIHHKKNYYQSNGQPFAFENPSESVVLQLADGSVMLNSRTESPEQRRVITFSKDGATDWAIPYFDTTLFDPICLGSLIRFSKGDKNRIIFVNPDSRGRPKVWGENRARQNLTVRLSYDEGKTWPVSKVLDAEIAGYSDIAVGPDQQIYVFYEDEGVDGNQFDIKYLTLAKFSLSWLTNGKDNILKK